jgi:hypothetical protein
MNTWRGVVKHLHVISSGVLAVNIAERIVAEEKELASMHDNNL